MKAPPAPHDPPWLDDAAGRLVRPYQVSNGRTRPASALDLLSLVHATGEPAHHAWGPDHAQALQLCASPVSVAEVAGHLRLPAVVTKVLLSDLLECGAVVAQAPRFPARACDDRSLLEAVLDGLRRRL
ncbi:DUF742 domain-containing protein [Streptomyces sp. NPDC006879]|uniref:DUF742 domain-containing protein n=1 Tax=Streptomyces sp. NPDC006879 TaxID=3364767 RepID=UPI0036849509